MKATSLPSVGIRGQRVLLVGCGDGSEITRNPVFAGASLTGIDIDAAAIDRARAALPEVEFHVCKAQELPFASGSFDVVYSGVAHPYTPLRTALAEASRVLVPGGLLLTTLHTQWQQTYWIREAWRNRHWKRVIDHGYVFPTSYVQSLTGISVPKFWRHSDSPSRYENFQTTGRVCMELERAGFDLVRMEIVRRQRDGEPWEDFSVQAVKAREARRPAWLVRKYRAFWAKHDREWEEYKNDPESWR